MYREFITFKEDTPAEALEELKKICSYTHNNNAGTAEIKIVSDREFIFEGGEDLFVCLQIGFVHLCDYDLFKKYIKTWYWEDEEPEESCDLLVETKKLF